MGPPSSLEEDPCVEGIICLLIDPDDVPRPAVGRLPQLIGFHGPMTQDRIRLIQPSRPTPTRARGLILLAAAVMLLLVPSLLEAQSLRGSRTSVDRQVRMARQHDFTFMETPGQVERFVRAGYLVPVHGNRDFELHRVSFPYARPETRTFITRLANQYRRACGEKLVVTSLTRPNSRQPWNASSRSVHPTGMAVDMRRSNSRACRSWLESVLLSLEKTGVLEATREYRPPHYHVAIFPKPYARYVANLTARNQARVAASDVLDYQVRRGDSLWEIARSHNTTVDRLREANDLRGSRIYAGQVLRVPLGH